VFVITLFSWYIRNDMRALLTLTTDFGLRDPYVGEMKGVLAACAPEAAVIDLTHHVPQGNLAAGSFVLSGSFGYFPPGTLHLVVVDPGVGTGRDILLVRTGRYRFMGPDNGVLDEAVRTDGIRDIRALDQERFFRALAGRFAGNPVAERILRAGPSATFHGRDLFAPFCAYLLEGGDPGPVTSGREELAGLELPRAKIAPGRVNGRVVYVDGFGNLITNVPAGAVDPEGEVFIRTGATVQSVGRLRHTYAGAKRGEPLALIGSRGYLEIGVNGGSARDRLGGGYGDGVLVITRGGPGSQRRVVAGP
jgi:hypothetical protein